LYIKLVSIKELYYDARPTKSQEQRLSKFPLAFQDNGKLANKKRYFKE